MQFEFHAIQQYGVRTGRKVTEALLPLHEAINKATQHTLEEVKAMEFSIIKHKKGDTYKVWRDENIKEDICGIVRDGRLVTVLTKDMYSWHTKQSKIRNDMLLRQEYKLS